MNLIESRNLAEHFHVDSAGTGGWHVGSEADERMRNAAKKRGIDIKSIARQVKLNDLKFFDFHHCL